MTNENFLGALPKHFRNAGLELGIVRSIDLNDLEIALSEFALVKVEEWKAIEDLIDDCAALKGQLPITSELKRKAIAIFQSKPEAIK